MESVGRIGLIGDARTTTKAELPERSEVTLQFIVREWDQIQQTPALQARLRDLEVTRQRAAPELAGLITDYYNVLSSYLRQRDKAGLILTSTTRDTNTRLKTLVREAVKQLDALTPDEWRCGPRPIRRRSRSPATASKTLVFATKPVRIQ